MQGFGRDLAYGLRNLRRHRGYTAVALAVLGTAIGLNTSLFTAFNAVALRPWPVPEADRVVRVFAVSSGGSGPKYTGMSVAEYRYLSAQAHAVSGLVAMREAEAGGLRGHYVSASFFDVLRVPFALGRGFRAEDDRPGAPAVAVVSHRLWQERFAGAANVIGRTLEVRKVPFVVVGVAAREFTGTSTKHEDVWFPLAAATVLHPRESWPKEFLTQPAWGGTWIAARLAPGTSADQARAELAHLSRQFRSSAGLEEQGVALAGTSLAAHLRERDKMLPVAGLLFLALTLVLLLACANVGNVVLARGLARRQEIAVRLSLGASRARLVRQLLTESLVLAGAAGLLGVGIAFLLPRYLTLLIADLAPVLRPDVAVLGYSAGVVVLACLAFGLAPAFHCTRAATGAALNNRGETFGTRLALRGALLAVQVAVSVVLLAGAGLLVRGVRHAADLDPGFAVRDVAAVSFSVDGRVYDDARKQAFVDGLERELAALPGAPAFGFTNVIPLGYQRSRINVQLPGQDKSRGGSAHVKEISAGYFDVLKIPIVLGRSLTSGDRERPIVLVSESLARRYWPNENPLGRWLVVGPGEREVIGVARDARTDDLDAADVTVYLPMLRPFVPSVLVRDDGRGTRETMAAVAARLDPDARVHVQPLAANIDRKLQPSRVGAAVAGAIGVLGLVLATIGLGGVFAYAVHQRTREIGVRVALGAQTADVVRLVLGSSARATVIGIALGLAGAVAGSFLLRSQLYGLSPLDPVAYGGVALLLGLAVAMASYLPTRRALRIDPAVALRYE